MSPFAENAQGKPFTEVPALHPDEHAWIEGIIGRTLTNDEAQSLLREAKLTASWEDIYGKRNSVPVALTVSEAGNANR